jgi:NADH dehydrogenase
MILVTGGSGYIGSHIVKRLAGQGQRVRALVRDPARAEAEGRLAGLDVEWAVGDVTRPETLAPAMQGVDTVVHTVAIAIEKGGRTYEQVNTQGTIHVVEAAKAAGARRFINQSQMAADASLPYRFLASKGRAQDYVAASGLDWTAFRPSVVFGPEDEFANTFARLIPLTPLIFPIVGSGQVRFEPVWVADLVTCIAGAVGDPTTKGQEFEIGGPEILTLEEIERRVMTAVGARRVWVRFPLPLIRLVVALMEILLPAPPVTRSLLELLAVDNVTRSNALRRFVAEPTAFTPDVIRPYVRRFRVRDTIRQYLGR